jgi:hypothetical protein
MTQEISGAETVDLCRAHGACDKPIEATPCSKRNQRGMVSAEWAVGIIAAVAIAGVLLAIVTNGQTEAALLKFILDVIRSFSNYIK